MQRKASALPFLLALAIACAHGEALFTDPVATNSANAPLIWLNRETTAATTLTLTREPDGGDTIAVIPRGGSITVLMRDADGHTLAKTPFGITGWAQVNGRNAISWPEKFRLDVWYVENRSLLLDIKILFLTVKKVLNRSGINSEGEATAAKFTGNDDA